MPFLETTNLSKTYRMSRQVAAQALRGVSLSVEDGEFLVIAGPSGSGKSTLLHLCGALDVPSTGDIRVNGKDIGTFTPSQRAEYRLRHVGFVFQAYNLIAVLTALENVEYVMRLQGVPAPLRRRRAQALLRQVGLTDKGDRRPAQLSGGEQQRVAVARAIAAEPRLVLADEPTANLDSATGLALVELMKRLNREARITVLIATHDPMIMGQADRVVRLKDGQVVESP